jgi:hypothetical protein
MKNKFAHLLRQAAITNEKAAQQAACPLLQSPG